MSRKKKIILSISIIGLFLISLAISYAYFSAIIYNNEETSTIVGTAAYLELTFIDGSKEISGSNILPGWSESKTFQVQNTGENTAYYVLKITDITNPFVYPGISYKIESEDGGANVDLDTLPLADMPITGPIEIPVNTTHNYTITTYYNELEESQMQDLGKTFSYTVSIEAVYKKEIGYIEDLVDLSNEVNNGNGYEHTWFVLTRDLDFNSDNSYKNANNTTTYGDYNGNGTVEPIKTELTTGEGFIPIGNKDNMFYGSFDGQNHRLNNLYINNTISDTSIGLFGHISGSTISHLTAKGTIITTVIANAGLIGVVVGGNVAVKNIINEINISSNVGSYSIGGIVGAINSACITIRNSGNKGIITNGNNTGGLVGYNNDTLIIENSYNEGRVTNGKGNHAGGLLGRDNASTNITKIYNSSNAGDVIGTTYTGGLIGRVVGAFRTYNSYNEGIITKLTIDESSSTYASVGGLIGEINSGIIQNSYNTGNVSGGTSVGGLIGTKSNTNSKNSLLINKCYNEGNINSKSFSGGIIGNVAHSACSANNYDKTYVINSYNNGNISSSFNAGGIFGRVEVYSYAINSYNAKNITASTACGIAGNVHFSCSYSKISLNNVYNYGEMFGADIRYGLFDHDNFQVNIGNINNAYYLNSIQGNSHSNIGISLTAEYMASPEFVNLLNQNKRNIDLVTTYGNDLNDYELSDWKYDSTKGYPILDN